jgi:hypothetical protein
MQLTTSTSLQVNEPEAEPYYYLSYSLILTSANTLVFSIVGISFLHIFDLKI